MTVSTKKLLALLLLVILLPLGAPAATSNPWVGSWAAAPLAGPNRDARYGSAELTLREIVHVSVGGSAARIILSNEFGLEPLTIGAANIALSSGPAEIDPASASAITFGGRPSVTIPPGALVVSDPAELKLPALANVAVSLFLPAQPIQQLSEHPFADQTNYIAGGNVVSARSLPSPTPIYAWPFLKGIDVRVSAKGASLVAFGDSITDGALSTRDANARWPDVLARRLQANKKTSSIGVLNEGIGGNRILYDGTGPSALARFDRDVLAQSEVKYLILLEGINDIGNATSPSNPHDPVTADDLIGGFSQLITRAHTHGIKVFGATLTPYVGAKYQSPAGEAMRQALNQWIRTTPQLDGVIDFDKATTDPTHPGMFQFLDDSGDHLHPGDAGYKSMGNAIDLDLFTR